MISFFKKVDRYLKRKEQAKKSLQFYKQFITYGDVVFDVGANIGERAEVFLKAGGSVVCVEPQTNCLAILHKKFDANNKVTIIDKALGEKEGIGEMSVCITDSVISTMSEKWKTEGRFSNDYTHTQTAQVAVTTLDILITQYGLPKFCKIDVEGFELNVIKGLSKPIPFISFEFTKEFLKDAQEIVTHLSAIGNLQVNCSIGESMLLLNPEWLSVEKLFAQLYATADELLWGDIYVKFL